MLTYCLEDLYEDFDEKTYNRGAAYYRQGHVKKIVMWGNVLQGQVQGSELYHVDITFHSPEELSDFHRFEGLCSCPVVFNCKHAVATLIAHFEDQKRSLSASLSNPQNSPALRHTTEGWLSQLGASFQDPVPVSQEKKKRQTILVYTLHIDEEECVRLNIYKTSLKKNGEYGQNRSFYDALNFNSRRLSRYISFEDIGLLTYLQQAINSYDYLDAGYSISAFSDAHFIEKVLATGRAHWGEREGPLLHQGPLKQSSLRWEVLENGTQKLVPFLEEEEVFLKMRSFWTIHTQTGLCAPLDVGLSQTLSHHLLKAPALNPEEAIVVRDKLQTLDPSLPLPDILTVTDHYEVPTPCITLYGSSLKKFNRGQNFCEIGCAALSFQYQDQPISDKRQKDFVTVYKDKEVHKFHRHQEKEAEIKAFLLKKGLIKLGKYHENYYANRDLNPLFSWDDYTMNVGVSSLHTDRFAHKWMTFMTEVVPLLKESGWQVLIEEDFPYNIIHADDDWYTDVIEGSTNNWFQFELGVSVNGELVNLLPILLRALQDQSHIFHSHPEEINSEEIWTFKMPNSLKLALPARRVSKILHFLQDLYQGKTLDENDQLTLSKADALQIGELDELTGSFNVTWRGSKKIRDLGRKLRTFKGIKKVPLSKTIQADLRKYQQEGINWLHFLRTYELSGILADDMGLGKTLQALSHIACLKEKSLLKGPILVVTPTSVVFNWQNEAARFTPSLKVLVLHGSERQKHFIQIENYDVIVTTYPLVLRDEALLKEHVFDTLILDEAHYIKNPQAKITKIICDLQASHKLSLTGTPVENNLLELWSQFNFLMPGFLGTRREFKRVFKDPIEKDKSPSVQKSLVKRLKPFLLRRDKNQVLKELPPKTEIIKTITLEKDQRDLYEVIRVSMQQKVQEAISDKGFNRSHIMVLEALLKLRQVCCDPRLLKMASAAKVKDSSKLETLMHMVTEMVPEGRKIIIFSQFSSMLSLIEERLLSEKIDYAKITGKTKNRQQQIAAFQEGRVPVFLISLKAGGTGLTLTAADTVIHYDPWWNPATEEQATDRAYRIGQDKPVFVYKLITAGTVEEKILEMQHRKRELSRSILSATPAKSNALSLEDINILFTPLESREAA